MMTLEELEAIPKATLTPEQVASYLGCSPQNIRNQAQANATALGFPCIVMGSTVRIPRLAFCNYMRYGHVLVQRRMTP